MAKKTKKECSPEERLAAARVPKEEWPYELPEGWEWVRLEGVATHISDGSHNPPKDTGVGIPILSAVNIHDHMIDIESATRWITEEQWEKENQRTKIEENDVLLTIVATLGRTAVVGKEVFALQRSVAVIKPTINSRFLSYFFESPFIQQYMIDHAKGTAQKGFYLASLKKMPCIVPPLETQQRIVDHIESLFAKLDQAKEKAQQALATSEPRKAAILHQAFTGQLTEKWRAENGVVLDEWEEKKFGELVADARLGLVRSKKEQGNNKQYKYLKMNNITSDGRVDLSDIVFVDADENEADWFELRHGDFLFNTRNSYELVGKNAVWDLNCSNQVLFNNNLMRVRFKQGINPFLVSFYLNSNEGKRKLDSCKKNTTNIAAIYAKNLNQILIPIMCESEQQKIVRILDELLAKEQQITALAEAVLDEIEATKKSILAKAFRGEWHK